MMHDVPVLKSVTGTTEQVVPPVDHQHVVPVRSSVPPLGLMMMKIGSGTAVMNRSGNYAARTIIIIIILLKEFVRPPGGK